MLVLLSLLACSLQASSLVSYGSQPYLDGMWEARALTCEAGLEEAMALYAAGERTDASELVQAVYEGSYEPELEPLVRELVGAEANLEVEYRFGLLRQAMQGRDGERVEAQSQALSAALSRHGQQLDGLRAVLR
jgi:hypothetical protein